MMDDDDRIEVNGYKEIFLFPVGDKTIILAENENAPQRYIAGEYESNEIFERINNPVASNDYLTAVESYLTKCSEQLTWANENIPKDMGVINPEDCSHIDYNTDLTNKVIAMKLSSLRREYQSIDNQICLVTGGNGARPNSLGRKIFVTNLYSGEHYFIVRENIMGIVKKDKMPNWALKNLNTIKAKENAERSER